MTVAQAARECVNNHARDHFWWYDRPPDPENWTVVMLASRDSEPKERERLRAVKAVMERHLSGDDPDAAFMHCTHWAVGWVEGYAVRVYRGDVVTQAFRDFLEVTRRLAPHLDNNAAASDAATGPAHTGG